ncbi:MAG: HNH endonuclease domain-containing protein [Bacteroidales bacterium]|nr:HNH endonuclease domain-containing protein [Bacteroidales bacterium]
MKNILGLDLGTNSIGWALIKHDFDNNIGEINEIGCRIIPMSQDILDTFGKGQSHSQTAERTHYRSVRRLYQRDNLRRDRLHRVLKILGFLPEHYARAIDFDTHPGQFKHLKNGFIETKINYIPKGYKSNGKPAFEFFFWDRFKEMTEDFAKNGNKVNIPPDWTIYYLRKKALTQKVGKEELAWILLHFNQKRGYYQRGDEEEHDKSKTEEFHALKVIDVVDSGDSNERGTWYSVILENGWEYRRQSKISLDEWKGTIKEFIVTTQLDAEGKPKTRDDGDILRTFRAVDSEKDWIAIKSKTENDIEGSGKTVGEYIYDSLRQKTEQKIRGKLVRTIERKYYKNELKIILETQQGYHPELMDRKLYESCLLELYPNNEAHRNNVKNRDFIYLFLDDIIFYQRPLKSKKSTISECRLESRIFKKTKQDLTSKGDLTEQEEMVQEGLKCIPKSHPFFQEFRLWQFLNNLKIYKSEIKGDTDVTQALMSSEEEYAGLYCSLRIRREIEQKHVIDFFVKQKKISRPEKDLYKWNYVEDKKYPGNETWSQFSLRLGKMEGIKAESFLTLENEIHLWHIIYSIHDKAEYEKALATYAHRYNLNEIAFVELFRNFKPFEKDYGSYSEKAIKKLLPLMRRGTFWREDQIQSGTKIRIQKIIDGEFDETIKDRVRERTLKLNRLSDFQGLPTWLASYVVYDRHSESIATSKWKCPSDIDHCLMEFKQHSLRNPIVEQVITETLRVVKDIWVKYGNGEQDFFDEIHVELGRDLKNPADKRKEISYRIAENENTNNRIRLLLQELMNDISIEGEVRSFSPSHQEILKIYEEGVYLSNGQVDNEIDRIRRSSSPTPTEIRKYRLWLEQGYISPYTGQVIPLSKLFTTHYQIEHIIPQARYFDDSLSNKIICESEVNELKGKQTAFEFIRRMDGANVELTEGRMVKLFDSDEFEDHCSRYFKGNKAKLKRLLSEEIPEGFINRQMNDSRYISKVIMAMFNNLVRKEDDLESISPRLLPLVGAITAKLKRDWGLDDKWNEIISHRFQRLNHVTGTEDYGFWDSSINAYRCNVPDSEKKGFSYKRIDHRHHALDALIIACANRKHIQYLNTLNNEKENYPLREKLLVKSSQGHYTKTMHMPWKDFPGDASRALKTTVISFKQNNRIINKTKNQTWKWVLKNGVKRKILITQTSGDHWAIRKPLHKETVSGLVQIRMKKTVSFTNGIKDWRNLVDKQLKRKIKSLVSNGIYDEALLKYFRKNPYLLNGSPLEKLDLYYYTSGATASRIPLSEKFTRKQLESVTDSGIRKILDNHASQYKDAKGNEHFELAFNPEGIDRLNNNIVELNGGKYHHPIYKVRVFEIGKKFPLGSDGYKAKKYVEAAKGTNLFFAVYQNDKSGRREYASVPLNEIIEWQKQESHLPKKDRTMIPLDYGKGRLLFIISPNELVYLPTDEEIANPASFDARNFSPEQVGRIYKMVSSTGSSCFFVPLAVAKVIVNKLEFSQLNKMERAIDGTMIKENCWKLEVDRLGNIIRALK